MLLLQSELPTELQNKVLELHPYNPLAYGALLLLLLGIIYFLYNLYKKEIEFNKELREELKVFNRQFLELLIKVEYKLVSYEDTQSKLRETLIEFNLKQKSKTR